MTVGRGASILSLPSPSVIPREPHGLPHTAKSETGGHCLSEGLSRVLGITKMWDNGQEQMAELRQAVVWGLSALMKTVIKTLVLPLGRPDAIR